MKNDEFGDRMKQYEKVYTQQRIGINDYLCVRIDGKGFSKFTRGFEKPFDQNLSNAMIRTASAILKETHAAIAYTQSDEMTFIYKPSEKATEYMFGGKVSKINSVLASMATAHFNKIISEYVLYNSDDGTCGTIDKLAYFDCRAWAVPSIIEASNVLLWRAQDAKKNSVSAMCRWTAGHKKMKDLNQVQMIVLMQKDGHNWHALENKWKYGTFIKNKQIEVSLGVYRSRVEPIEIGYYGDMSLEDRIELI